MQRQRWRSRRRAIRKMRRRLALLFLSCILTLHLLRLGTAVAGKRFKSVAEAEAQGRWRLPTFHLLVPFMCKPNSDSAGLHRGYTRTSPSSLTPWAASSASGGTGEEGAGREAERVVMLVFVDGADSKATGGTGTVGTGSGARAAPWGGRGRSGQRRNRRSIRATDATFELRSGCQTVR